MTRESTRIPPSYREAREVLGMSSILINGTSRVFHIMNLFSDTAPENWMLLRARTNRAVESVTPLIRGCAVFSS